MRLKVIFATSLLATSVVMAPVGASAQSAPANANSASVDSREPSAKDKAAESRKRPAIQGPNQGMLPSTQTDGPSPEKMVASVGAGGEVVTSGGFSGRTVFGY